MPTNNFKVISNCERTSIIDDSDAELKFIGFGNRNVAVIDLNKSSNDIFVSKTWSFNSDMIKIIYEDDGNVLFLNCENFLCIMNSKYQSQVSILCKKSYIQAAMLVKNESGSWYIFTECNKTTELIEINNCKITNRWELTYDAKVLSISVRGFCLNFKTSNGIFYLRIKNSENLPFELIKCKSDEFEAIDILDDPKDDSESHNFIGYMRSISGNEISFNETYGNSILNIFSLKDTSLNQCKLDFGRYICFSSI